MPNSLPTTVIRVNDDTALQQACLAMQKQDVIAVDTEFQRTDTFYPQAGLLQFSDGDTSYIVDPLLIEDFSPIQTLFRDLNVVKLIHASSEDLVVFQHLFDTLPTPMCDTQVAATFLNYGMSIGYSNLVREVLGLDLEKGETRSDWLQRPLTESQLHYAVQDVVYLPRIYRQMRDQLNDLNRMAWVEEECQQLLDDAENFEDYDDYYLKVKSGWKLDRLGLGVLKALCNWRETEARRKDKPRNRLIKEPVLWEVARWRPIEFSELQRIKGMMPREKRQYGELIVDIVLSIKQLPEEDLPELLAKPLPTKVSLKIKPLKTLVRTIAEDIGLPPEYVFKKKDYEYLVRSGYQTSNYQLPDTLSQWRSALVGQKLIDALKLAH